MLLSELIDETHRLLLTGSREERNRTAAALTNSATSITMAYPLGSIQRGSKLSINLEDLYVWGASSLTVSPVDRGQFGSAAVSHAAFSTVFVNPKFSSFEVYNAINQELDALSSPALGLFRVSTTELTYNPAISGYALAGTNILGVHEVRYQIPGPSREYPISQDWELTRDMSDEFTPNTVLFVRDAFPGRTVLVKAKLPFVRLPAVLSTDLSTTFLPATALDILSIGAAWRLTSPREIRRNFDEVQGDTRRSEEVPPGANLGGARELGRLRLQRINEEVSRLNSLYPSRSPRYPFAVGG